jgi:isoleucyl-tRNA synthetase
MSFPYIEYELNILQRWKENKIFEKQQDRTRNNKRFTYFDGPPFATGLPHYGHIVASILKDIIPRYKSMMGYYVPRRWCWDVHGLPIEFEIEKKLGIKTKEDIMKLGIYKYNEECRSIVMTYSDQWKKTIERIGRWVDMDKNVKTMDLFYMNSVWWIFHNMWSNGLVYEGVKVMPYSTGCATPLSNFESKSNYRKISDPSIVVKFAIMGVGGGWTGNLFFLIWTTTPWTLPSNLALCVHPQLNYAKVEKDGEYYYLLESQLEKYGFDRANIVEKIVGSALIGLAYEPLYPFFQEKYATVAYKVVGDCYIKEDNGTGIVHQAPAFGEDDYRVCLEKGIINKLEEPPCPFDANGYFTGEVDFVKGLFFKEADKVIIKNLKERGHMWDLKYETHDYPFCWRSNQPLMYRIVPCTFINVEKIKERIIRNNREETNWVPEHIKMGRFGNWLEEAKDWCVSRNRYWGTPIPIWKSVDGDTICVDSYRRLEELAGMQVGSIKDIHRHHIDQIVIHQNGKEYRRIEEVFDCWFESGSLPFASQNYPYSSIQSFNYPADFIAEGIDQTRGWFYTLLVIGTAIFDKSPFKNVIVNGLVLAEDGEKMSKSKKNYPDPNEILNKYGADALRLYLIGTPIVKGEAIKFKESGVADIVKTIHQFAFNTLTFVQQMVPLYEQKYGKRFNYYNFQTNIVMLNLMDIMMLNYLQEFITTTHKEMDEYYLGNIVNRIEKFIGQLSRTYLNMNKSRLKSQLTEKDALDSLNTTHYCLKNFAIMIAPFAPFMADHIYLGLEPSKTASVHLQKLPVNIWNNYDQKLVGQDGINLIEKIIDARGEIRSAVLKSAKKPVLKQTIYLENPRLVSFLKNIRETLEKECNIEELVISKDYGLFVKKGVQINQANIGKKFKKDAKTVIQRVKELEDDVAKILEIVGEDDITVVDVLDGARIGEGFYSQFYAGDGLLIVSDLTWNAELEKKYQIRRICRTIMNARKEMGLVPTDAAILGYKNSFGGGGGGRLIEDNLEGFKQQIDMGIVDEWDGMIEYTKKFEFDYEDGNMHYKFCIFK